MYTKWYAEDKEFALPEVLHGDSVAQDRPARIQCRKVLDMTAGVHLFTPDHRDSLKVQGNL